MNNMDVPFVDLASQFRNLESELTKAFLDVGRSGVGLRQTRTSLLCLPLVRMQRLGWESWRQAMDSWSAR